jgi:hypothetical protein
VERAAAEEKIESSGNVGGGKETKTEIYTIEVVSTQARLKKTNRALAHLIRRMKAKG